MDWMLTSKEKKKNEEKVHLSEDDILERALYSDM